MPLASTRTPPLPEILSALLEHALADVHVALPGRVERVDTARGVADVKPLLQGWRENDSGERVSVSQSVIPNVPIMWQGGGGLRATFPLAPGDTVLLIFSDRGLDRWKGLDGEVDPQNFNAHSIADAVCIPGLRSVKNALQSFPSDKATFGQDSGSQIQVGQDGSITIDAPGHIVQVNASATRLGASAVEALVKGTSYSVHMALAATQATTLATALSVPLLLPPNAAAASAAATALAAIFTLLAADISAQNTTI